MNAPRRFWYSFDPVCIGSMLLHALGRWYLKPHHIGGMFVCGYLNDVLCLPLFLPMILHVQRLTGLRRHDGPPRVWEMLQHWAVFSVVFEVVIPRFPNIWRSVGDPWDVLAYLVGGIGAMVIWRWREVVAAVGMAAADLRLGKSRRSKEQLEGACFVMRSREERCARAESSGVPLDHGRDAHAT